MTKKQYKHDKVQWDKKSQKFLIKWVDAVAQFKGENAHKKTTRKWKGKTKPTKEEIQKEIEKLEEEIEALEESLREEAENLKFGIEKKTDDVILVSEWFKNLPDSELTFKAEATLEATRKRRRIANAFSKWSSIFYPELYLHEVREKHITDYFNWRKENPDSKKGNTKTPYAHSSLDGERKVLKRFFNRICKIFIDSKLPFRNPLDDFSTDTIVKKTTTRYEPLSIEQMQSLYNEVDSAKGYTAGDYKLQLKAMVYFHLVTGWRTEQVCTLSWDEIDLKNRQIAITHKKTEEQGTRTILYITDKMLDILTTLKNKFKNHKLNYFPNQVFGLRKHGGGEVATVAQMKAYFSSWREKHGYNKLKCDGMTKVHAISVESIRCGLIQELSMDFNVERVNYMAGHSNGSINSNHYLMLEKDFIRATKDMLEQMENKIGVQFWTEEARIQWELKQQEEFIKKERGQLQFNQGGILITKDPRTGEQMKIDL